MNVIEILIAAKDMASAPIRNIGGSLGGLNTSLAAFGGPAGVALVGLTALGAGATAAVLSVKSLAEEAHRLSNVAQQTGTSVEAIQTIGIAFERAGLSAADASLALRFLNRSIADQNPLLAHLGATSKDVYTAFLQLADSPISVAEALNLLGRSGNIAIPVLRQGSAAIKALGDEGRATGATLSTNMVASLSAVDVQFKQLNEQMLGLKRTIVSELAPAISFMLTGVLNLAEGFKRLEIWSFAAAIGINAVLGIVSKANREAMNDLIKKLKELAEQFAAMERAKAAPGGEKPRGDADVVIPGTGMTIAQMKEAVEWITKLERPLTEGLGIRGFRANPKLKPDTMVDVPATVIDSKTRALEGFRKTMDEITDAGSIMSDTLSEAFNALDTGFRGVFTSIVEGGRGFAAALRNVFRGLVDAIISELSRLAAAAVFKLLLSFFTGGIGGGIPNVPGPISGKVYGAAPVAPDILRSGGGGNTFNITTLAPASVLAEILDPSGSFRRANLRVSELGAL